MTQILDEDGREVGETKMVFEAGDPSPRRHTLGVALLNACELKIGTK